MSKKILAIIPARGGSKRIPRKNIKSFLGKPVIKYSVDAAIESACFDEIMVSTDDKEIANIAIKYGAKVPFFRSTKNSDDHATTADVIKEVLLKYQELEKKYDYVCCLYATAPFITPEKIKKAKKILEQSNVDSVFSITSFSSPIQRSFKLDDEGRIKMNWPENINIRSQDLRPTYHDAGQLYFLNVAKFLANKKIFSNNSKAIIVPETEVQDIDNETDWKLAELKYKLFTKSNGK